MHRGLRNILVGKPQGKRQVGRSEHMWEIQAHSMHGGIRNTYMILVGKPRRKRHPGRPKCTCEYNEKVLRETGYKTVDWMEVTTNRFQKQAIS